MKTAWLAEQQQCHRKGHAAVSAAVGQVVADEFRHVAVALSVWIQISRFVFVFVLETYMAVEGRLGHASGSSSGGTHFHMTMQEDVDKFIDGRSKIMFGDEAKGSDSEQGEDDVDVVACPFVLSCWPLVSTS